MFILQKWVFFRNVWSEFYIFNGELFHKRSGRQISEYSHVFNLFLWSKLHILTVYFDQNCFWSNPLLLLLFIWEFFFMTVYGNIIICRDQSCFVESYCFGWAVDRYSKPGLGMSPVIHDVFVRKSGESGLRVFSMIIVAWSCKLITSAATFLSIKRSRSLQNGWIKR